MRILKFGGTSVKTPEAIRQTMDIILKSQKAGPIAVVVSAFGGITDMLIETSQKAAAGDTQYISDFQKIHEIHLHAVKELIRLNNQSAVLAEFKMTLRELEDMLHGTFLIREVTVRTLDFIMSFGERLSAGIISEAFKTMDIDAEYLDARSLVKTDENFGEAKVEFECTYENIRRHFQKHPDLQIITGFIGSTDSQETTTLGRGGSDYTASIFGAALDAEEIEIWTDVDGVLTADPRKVKKAFPIESLTYQEAMEMSHFGAKVIHPPTMQPALRKNIPIRIKNTFNPEAPGSLISDKKSAPAGRAITGITAINDIGLLRLEGGGLVGVVGMSSRLFGALARADINIIMISQASSEHSICFAVPLKDARAAKKTIEKEFALEIAAGQISEVVVEEDTSIIAVVGENMRRTAGISGRLFGALGRNGISAIAIAQGSSELNISVVIKKNDQAKALNSIHDAFFLSDAKSVHLYLIGIGLIGAALLSQLEKQALSLREKIRLDIKIAGLANSRKMYFDENGIELEKWAEKLENAGEKMNAEQFLKKMQQLNLENSIFVDCTGSEAIAELYEKILKSSISIVTPSKKANSGSYAHYVRLKQIAGTHNVTLRYETNVGAGLPVLSVIDELLLSGDRIEKIEAVLSGTLSYIFNKYDGKKSFAQVVKEAQEKGFTEPDPREDLSGMDVARKILILAREAGHRLELKDVKIEKILPPALAKAKSVQEFYQQLEKNEKFFREKVEKARKEAKVLRYIASLKNRNAKVELLAVGHTHPFYSLTGSDNIISFTTERYNDTPLVVKGPGAGAEVTAAGVFADIIKTANHNSAFQLQNIPVGLDRSHRNPEVKNEKVEKILQKIS